MPGRRRRSTSGAGQAVEAKGGPVWGRLEADALRALFDTAQEGLILLSGEGQIVHANPAAQKLFGGASRSLTENVRQMTLAPGSCQAVQVEPGGEVAEVHASLIELGGERARLLTVHDLTSQNRTQQERDAGRQQALATSQIKGEVLNLVAHEFRSPLSVIGGYLSMMAEGQLGDVPPMWCVPLARAQQKVAELEGMVNAVLTAARLESGRLQGNPRELDAGTLVKLAAERAEGRAALLDADVSWEVPDEPVPVSVDGHQLGIVLDNLINNALSYSEGKPELRIMCASEAGEAEISVCDHGPGVAPDMREAIFERFQRGGDQGEPHRRGIGLGLAIARDLAELNGGELRLAASELGKGSRFALRLPLASVVSGD